MRVPKLGVVVLAAAHLAHPGHDPCGAVGEVLVEPALEDRIHFPGQAQDDAERRGRACRRGRLEDALDLRLVDERDDRRDAHAHRHAGAGQRLHRLQPAMRRRGARLEDPGELRVERGDRDVDRHQAARRHRRHQVEVALDARRLGDQRERMRALGHHLDHRAGDAEPALDRLVGVGGRADVDRRRLVGAAGERFAQALRGVDLGDDLRLEVEPGREVEVAVRRPGEAVDAAVLAAAVRVDREVEVEVGRVVAGEDRLDALLDHGRLRRQPFLGGRLLQRAPAVVVAFARPGANSGARSPRPCRGPSPGRAPAPRAAALRRARSAGCGRAVVPYCEYIQFSADGALASQARIRALPENCMALRHGGLGR